MRIVWDEPKRLANLDKHGLDFQLLPVEFFEAALIRAVRSMRYQAVGQFGGRSLVVIFAPLGTEALSVISMRWANKKERTAAQ